MDKKRKLFFNSNKSLNSRSQKSSLLSGDNCVVSKLNNSQYGSNMHKSFQILDNLSGLLFSLLNKFLFISLLFWIKSDKSVLLFLKYMLLFEKELCINLFFLINLPKGFNLILIFVLLYSSLFFFLF